MTSSADRVRIEPSSAHVRVDVAGVTVADSHQAMVLFETGLPPRYYLPRSDVRFDLLEPSETVTHCPFKGDAQYWSLRLDTDRHADVAWSYGSPVARSERIAGLVCFYPGKVELYVDGAQQ